MQTQIKAILEMQANDSDRLQAARAGIKLQERYEIETTADDTLLSGLTADGRGKYGWISTSMLENFRKTLADNKGDVQAAYAVMRQKHAEQQARELAERAAEDARYAAEREQRRKIEAAKELLAADFEKLRSRITELEDEVQDERRAKEKLAEFVQHEKLESDYFEHLCSQQKDNARQKFAATFEIDEPEEDEEQ